MKISEKIRMEKGDLIKHGPITIVAFGDSVTHGALGIDEFDYDTVYWNRLRQKINQVRGYVPVNVINAGIGGVTAKESLSRMDKQVFAHNPDLVIVCFGLNDVDRPLEDYTSALRTIFERCNSEGVQTIFMTPNMMNTYIADDTAERHLAVAENTMKLQTSGRMDQYMQAAREVAAEQGIAVCDCYAKWKELSKTKDTTMLLSNRINHPTREMHRLFADSLFEMLFPDLPDVSGANNSSMQADYQ